MATELLFGQRDGRSPRHPLNVAMFKDAALARHSLTAASAGRPLGIARKLTPSVTPGITTVSPSHHILAGPLV
jgi:hypothetical protein